MALTSVCVFCASSHGRSPAYAEMAAALGSALAERGLRLVYGGGQVGLMGVVADAVLAGGGEVLGVIPDALERKEVGHRGLTELRVTASMHERKALMAQEADAFVALPGGLGTFEELCEILTWAQLGEHAKPVVILDVEDYYGPLFELFDRAVAEAFVRPEHRALANRATTVDEVFTVLSRPPPAPMAKWIDREET